MTTLKLPNLISSVPCSQIISQNPIGWYHCATLKTSFRLFAFFLVTFKSKHFPDCLEKWMVSFRVPAHPHSVASNTSPPLPFCSVSYRARWLACFHLDRLVFVRVLYTITVLVSVDRHAAFSFNNHPLFFCGMPALCKHTDTPTAHVPAVWYVARGKALLPNEPPALCFSWGAKRELTLMQHRGDVTCLYAVIAIAIFVRNSAHHMI